MLTTPISLVSLQVSSRSSAKSHTALIDQLVSSPLQFAAGVVWQRSSLDNGFKAMMSGWRVPRVWASPTSSSPPLQNDLKRANAARKWLDLCAWIARCLKLVEHLHARTMSMVSGVESRKKSGMLRVIDLSHLLACGHSPVTNSHLAVVLP